MRATSLYEFPARSEVGRLTYDLERLVVTILPGWLVAFPDAVGFRVLDEGDLLEFWPVCSARTGSGVFEVHDGGWLTQERSRQGFISGTTRQSLREFLVTGPDDCVGVLAFNAPAVERATL